MIGGVESVSIQIADYDPGWPARCDCEARRICDALGAAVRRREHIGSTFVPGLAAKPIIDVLLVVANSGDEASYLSALESAGDTLRAREPALHDHRMLRTATRDVHLHVLSFGCLEINRYLAFRDRLRQCASDQLRYESVKRDSAARPWPDMVAYADAKSDVVGSIFASTAREIE